MLLNYAFKLSHRLVDYRYVELEPLVSMKRMTHGPAITTIFPYSNTFSKNQTVLTVYAPKLSGAGKNPQQSLHTAQVIFRLEYLPLLISRRDQLCCHLQVIRVRQSDLSPDS